MTSPALRSLLTLAAAAGAMSIGCFRPEPIQEDQLRRGYILLLPGVECTTRSMEGIYHGLREGGVDRAIDLDIWGYRPFGTFRNLPAYELNRRRAARMAAKLVEYRGKYPDAPVSIVGFSGGGAMALFTAEALPPDYRLSRVIILGAAISPQYDVRPSLARTRDGVVNFYSPGDWLMAGWATRTFGTMDRVKCDTAGRFGFRDASGELLALPGLTQVGWCPDWRPLGHDGGHPGWLAQAWSREMLAPLLRD